MVVSVHPVARPDASGPRIVMLMLADRAEVLGGKLYAMGGFIGVATLPSFPAVLTVYVALAISAPWHEGELSMHVEVSFRDDKGKDLAGARLELVAGPSAVIHPGDYEYLPVAFPFVATIAEPGPYVIAASIDGDEQARYQMRVQHDPNASLAQQIVQRP